MTDVMPVTSWQSQTFEWELFHVGIVDGEEVYGWRGTRIWVENDADPTSGDYRGMGFSIPDARALRDALDQALEKVEG